MNRLKTRKLPAGVIIAGLLTGLAISGPVLAIESQPTGTVVGRAPVVTGDVAGEITVTDVDNNGIINTGDKVTINPAKLSQTDADNDAATGYDYTWKVGGTAVQGTTATEYVIKSADLGKKITLSVVGKTDPTKTDPAVSTAVIAKFAVNTAVGIAAVVPEITVAAATDVATAVITGFGAGGAPVVGTKLSVDVTMADGSKPAAGKVSYQWKVESAIGSGTYTNIATGGTTADYTPVAGDQKKHIVVEVTKK